ncbi:hypothetical protein R3X27_07865 [Tropicimonas sp. TH_r6]|uniref:hypothetical protein n=1 Tax=Tropicimonas sp. TH_r6 TaxID=3082085 RepID=UPI002954ED02|nr:hypothetical protein [Tropicimonas sp. TH_r6]MDV7142595.1 hypothetical protein [Tropicimonas sp. TH_r6]
MMYMTHYGALVPPKHKKYLRKVAKGRREHFTGQMNIGESGDEWIIDVESHTEMMVALILDGRRDVANFEN